MEHLTLSDNELIRQISTQLLTTTTDDMNSLSDYEYWYINNIVIIINLQLHLGFVTLQMLAILISDPYQV